MRRLLVATTNPHKLREIRDLLSDVEIDLVGLETLPPIDEPEETGTTFEENARIKALYYDRRAEALRHGTPEALRHGMAEALRHGMAEALRHGTAEALRHAMGEAVHHGMAEALHDSKECGAGLQPCDLTVAEDSGLVVDALDGEPGVHSARFLGAGASYAERFEEIFRRLDEHPERPPAARFICALAVVRDGRVVYETSGRVEGEITRPPRGSAGFGYDPIFYYPPYRCTLAEVTQASKLHVAHRGQAFRAFATWLKGG